MKSHHVHSQAQRVSQKNLHRLFASDTEDIFDRLQNSHLPVQDLYQQVLVAHLLDYQLMLQFHFLEHQIT